MSRGRHHGEQVLGEPLCSLLQDELRRDEPSVAYRPKNRTRQELLTLTNMPLADVTSHSGFGDEASFTRTFNRTVGATPGQWRREHGARPER